MIFGPDDYPLARQGVASETEVALMLAEIDRLRDELEFANDCLTKAAGHLANEPSRRCWCGR